MSPQNGESHGTIYISEGELFLRKKRRKGKRFFEMEQALWSFIFGIISALLGAVCGLMTGKIKAERKRRVKEEERFKKTEQALTLLMRSDLIRLHSAYMDKGSCPIAVKYSIKEEYDGYHALGGNGVATGMMEEIMLLPEN